MNNIFHGDCFKIVSTLPANSIDSIICDLPYGITKAKWDNVFRLYQFWKCCNHILKENGNIILTASQPFTSRLIMSNLDQFKCEWIWDKVNATNFLNAKIHPLKIHESILVFSPSNKYTYNPQKTKGKINHKSGDKSNSNLAETRNYTSRIENNLSGLKYPKSIQKFPKHSSQCKFHPTEKPIDLMRYLVKTYSNIGNTILDMTCGSGTTCLAAKLENRNFIGIELEEKYVKIANQRLH